MPPITDAPSPTHAKHWSHRVSSQVWQFKKLVHAAMMAVFKESPSLRLYSALLASSTDPETTEAELMRFLGQMGTSCPEAFAAALDIHALRNNTGALAQLLSTHAHLLRPRDVQAVQAAVLVLATDPQHQPRALALVEKEMLDTARAVRHTLLGAFSLLDEPENVSEMEQILRLRPAAAGRQASPSSSTKRLPKPRPRLRTSMASSAKVRDVCPGRARLSV